MFSMFYKDCGEMISIHSFLIIDQSLIMYEPRVWSQPCETFQRESVEPQNEYDTILRRIKKCVCFTAGYRLNRGLTYIFFCPDFLFFFPYNYSGTRGMTVDISVLAILNSLGR